MKAEKPDFRLFGQCLIERGSITQEQLDEAIEHQKTTMVGTKLGEILVEMGLINNMQVSETLAEQFTVPMLELAAYEVPAHIQGLVDAQVARRLRVIPVQEEGEILVVATTDPGDTRKLDEVAGLVGRPVLASLEDILAALDRYYTVGEGGLPR